MQQKTKGFFSFDGKHHSSWEGKLEYEYRIQKSKWHKKGTPLRVLQSLQSLMKLSDEIMTIQAQEIQSLMKNSRPPIAGGGGKVSVVTEKEMDKVIKKAKTPHVKNSIPHTPKPMGSRRK